MTLVRIALTAETFTPAVNGVVNSVRHVADELAARGHEPVVIAPSGETYRGARGARIPVVQVPSMPVPGYRRLAVARPGCGARGDPGRHRARRGPPGLARGPGASAVHAARDAGIPSVAIFQTDLSAFARRYHVGAGTRLVWARLRHIHNAADLTLVPSTVSAYQLRTHGIGPLALWARGVDGRRFHPLHRDDDWRRGLGVADELVVGFVGRLAHEKRVDLLAPVSRVPGVRLVIVGDGPRRAALQRLMPTATFTGQLTGDELGRAMASLDLLVHPGADETLCQVVQEALCAGVPVIATASGGPLDLVRHGVNGLLWAGDDPAVLAAQVADVRDDRAQLERMRAVARRSVVWRTWSRMTDELVGHYCDVLDARAGRQGHERRAG